MTERLGKYILSITTSGHGVGCALCVDGKIVAATTLERLTRKKYDILLPISKKDLKDFGWNANPKLYEAYIDLPFDLENDYYYVDFGKIADFHRIINYVLNIGGLSFKDIDTVVYSYRYVESAREYFNRLNPKINFIVPEHHFAHACQAFLPSPFEEAAIMVIDGQGVPLARTNGDQLSGCAGYGKANTIKIYKEFPVRYSLGGLYSAFTKKMGFKTNEECKLMGLASYGNAQYYDKLKGSVRFDVKEYNLSNFKDFIKRGFRPNEYIYSLNNYYEFLNKFRNKEKKEEYSDMHKNLSYAAQKMVEKAMIGIAKWLHKETGSKNLCIAGGVGLNCVANYQVLINSGFENIFVYPNAGDNGLSVGQALYAYTIAYGNKRNYITEHDYLGKEYQEQDFKGAIDLYCSREGISIKEYNNISQLYDDMAECIADGKITSWFQGRSEFGPRALGNRSIIADPRRKDMKDILNSRVKFRESFRPFTPSVLKERSPEFFELNIESPYMLLAPFVKPGKSEIVPAITHVDNTARVQTVDKNINERYYNLIKAFEYKTGVPMVLNTSFNVAGEPIVETPEDAVKCFLSTDIDILGIGRYLLRKNK